MKKTIRAMRILPCRTCGKETPHDLAEIGFFVTAMEIPIAPYKKRFVQLCQKCGAGEEIGKERFNGLLEYKIEAKSYDYAPADFDKPKKTVKKVVKKTVKEKAPKSNPKTTKGTSKSKIRKIVKTVKKEQSPAKAKAVKKVPPPPPKPRPEPVRKAKPKPSVIHLSEEKAPLPEAFGKPKDVKFCTNCGERVRAAAKFCKHCGGKLAPKRKFPKKEES